MNPASTTRSTPSASSQSPSARSRSARSAWSEIANTADSTPAASRAAQAAAPPRATRPPRRSRSARPGEWSWSSSACRLVPAPEIRTATRNGRHRSGGRRVGRQAQDRVGPAGGLEPARRRSARPPAPGCRRGACARSCRRRAGRRRSCAAASCCARRGGSPRRSCARPTGCAERATEMIASSRFSIATGSGGGGAGHQRRVARVAARARRARRRGAVAEVAQDRRAAAAVLLDVGPDLAVLAPARLDALLDRRPAERGRAAVEAAPSTRPATRSGADGDGEITPARVRCPSSERRRSPSPPRPRTSS